MSERRVLLLGGTGRTGGRVLAQLLERGVPVRAIVRDAGRLPEGVAGRPLLDVVEADLLELPVEELARHLEGCGTVISCLGHNVSLRGVFGKPRDLVTRAVTNVCGAARTRRTDEPLRLVLMSSVSVNRPKRADTRRGGVERVFLWLLRRLVPPANDNQRAADHLVQVIGTDGPIEWVAVRPDTLREGDVTGYRLHDELVSSIFRPDETQMSNVAHFMCELATDPDTWRRWRGKMPVIVDEAGS